MPAAQEEKKPSIDTKVLKEFILSKIKPGDKNKIYLIQDNYLWSVSDTDRYRINVYISRDVEGLTYGKRSIEYSWFVHYNKNTGEILDKTAHEKKTKKPS